MITILAKNSFSNLFKRLVITKLVVNIKTRYQTSLTDKPSLLRTNKSGKLLSVYVDQVACYRSASLHKHTKTITVPFTLGILRRNHAASDGHVTLMLLGASHRELKQYSKFPRIAD